MITSAAPSWTTADLWQHIYGDIPGLIAAFSGKREPGEQQLAEERSRYFKWPSQARAAEQWLQTESARGRCAYVCAHLLDEPTDEEKVQGIKPRRIKANAATMLALYVDGDGAEVPTHLPQPTARVQSSPGREQDYWRLTHAIDPKRGEQINRRLAYAMGADKSGWDLTQLLRPPGTQNHKYEDRPYVRVVSIEDRAYDPDELERILPELPDEAKPHAEVKLERSAAATPIGDRDRRAVERMYTWQRGPELQMLANGGSVHNDASADDLSYFGGLAFALDKDPVRMARIAEASARVRDKWYEVHSADGRTYLEMTIGAAIAGCSQSFRDLAGYGAGDDPPQIQFTPPDAPVSLSTTGGGATAVPTSEPTTLDEALAEIRRLRRRALDQDDKIETLTGIIEDQQAVIAATRAERDQERALRARDRRMALAEQRLDRVSQFSAGQKAAIKAVARIAPALANTHPVDDPIITREMVGAVYGAKVDTAGDHLAVFDIKGSPVLRVDKPYGAKTLKHFKLETRDPAEIVEQMATLGEQLEKRPTATKTPHCRACPEGTGTIVNIICEGCGCLLDERHVKARRTESTDNVEKNATLCPSSAPVNELVTYGGEKRHVAEAPETADTRATQMVGTSVTAVRLRPDDREPVSLGAVRTTRQPPPRCVRAGCEKPAANRFVCAGHLRGDPLPAVGGGSE